jgi:hypothetical protein
MTLRLAAEINVGEVVSTKLLYAKWQTGETDIGSKVI